MGQCLPNVHETVRQNSKGANHCVSKVRDLLQSNGLFFLGFGKTLALVAVTWHLPEVAATA